MFQCGLTLRQIRAGGREASPEERRANPGAPFFYPATGRSVRHEDGQVGLFQHVARGTAKDGLAKT